MDLTLKTKDGVLNYRVAGVIIHNDMLLAQYDKENCHFYLPGGRVKLHESSAEAMKRELKEEFDIDVTDFKPLWFNECFFIDELSGEKFHEIGIYYTFDISKTHFNHFENSFTLVENGRVNYFEWIPISLLNSVKIYPLFLRSEINNLPEYLTMIIDDEYGRDKLQKEFIKQPF